MYVKPKEGFVVRSPAPPYAPLPPEGAEVPESEIFWHRRIADGDVVLVTPSAAAPPPVLVPPPPAASDSKPAKSSRGGAQ